MHKWFPLRVDYWRGSFLCVPKLLLDPAILSGYSHFSFPSTLDFLKEYSSLPPPLPYYWFTPQSSKPLLLRSLLEATNDLQLTNPLNEFSVFILVNLSAECASVDSLFFWLLWVTLNLGSLNSITPSFSRLSCLTPGFYIQICFSFLYTLSLCSSP